MGYYEIVENEILDLYRNGDIKIGGTEIIGTDTAEEIMDFISYDDELVAKVCKRDGNEIPSAESKKCIKADVDLVMEALNEFYEDGRIEIDSIFRGILTDSVVDYRYVDQLAREYALFDGALKSASIKIYEMMH